MGVFEELLAELKQLRKEQAENNIKLERLLSKVEGPDQEEYLNIDKAAEFLNVSKYWFYNPKNREVVLKVNGKLMCKKSDLVNYINTRQRL